MGSWRGWLRRGVGVLVLLGAGLGLAVLSELVLVAHLDGLCRAEPAEACCSPDGSRCGREGYTIERRALALPVPMMPGGGGCGSKPGYVVLRDPAEAIVALTWVDHLDTQISCSDDQIAVMFRGPWPYDVPQGVLARARERLCGALDVHLIRLDACTRH